MCDPYIDFDGRDAWISIFVLHPAPPSPIKPKPGRHRSIVGRRHHRPYTRATGEKHFKNKTIPKVHDIPNLPITKSAQW